MANRYQNLEYNSEEISKALNSARDLGEYRRIQAIHLRVNLGFTVDNIAKATGFSSSYIRGLHTLYRKFNLSGLRSKNKGGRYNSHLSEAEEKAFIEPFIKIANRGGILEISKIHCGLEEFLGKKINRQVVYNILHRHGWRKIAPRPSHPKYCEKKADSFKKTLK